MNSYSISRLFVTALLCACTLAITGGLSRAGDTSHATAAQEQGERTGAHGGRLLSDGDLAIELLLSERGIETEFRAWITERDVLLTDASDARLVLELTRLGGNTERIQMTPTANYWRSESTVSEPHSFMVNVLLLRNGERSEWTYESYEGRVQIGEEMARETGIETAIAGAGEIQRSLILYGKTALAHDSMRHVRARFPGPVTEVSAELGDRVRRGQRLATVESNDSLQSYPVVSPLDGLVVEHEVASGELSGDRVLFTIANYDTMWAELHVFSRQQLQIRRGQKVVLSSDNRRVETEIFDVLPDHAGGPFLLARATFDNRSENWPPDLMIQGKVIVEQVQVPLVVENRALQPFGTGKAVFIKVGETYEARPLKLGRSDDRVTEVLEGLNVGDRYVTANSFLIKADIEKSGAAHDH